MNSINDKAKCRGESPEGKMICGYREQCARYVRPAGDRQVWAEFWRANEDCPQYESLGGAHGRSEQEQKTIAQNGNSAEHYEASNG